MPTPHEELLTLKRKASEALDQYVYADIHGMKGAPFFGYRKRLKSHIAAVSELKSTYDVLGAQYSKLFNKVLEEQHGVVPNDIVDDGREHCFDTHHDFTVLVGKKIREMSAVSVGNRVMFFLDGEALGEEEKVDYSA